MKRWIWTALCLMMAALTPFCAAGAETQKTLYADLGDSVVEDWDTFYQWLDQNPDLTKVDMFATPVGRERVEEMDARYPQITFGWTMKVGDHTVRTDATCFSTLHYTKDDSHSTEEIALLRFCTELRALDIGHNAVEDLSFLYELPELRVLIVACNYIEDITPIGSLRHLEYLEMFSNHVRDLSPLVDLPYLAHLNIGYNKISDLAPLHQMTQLKRLWMRKCHTRGSAPDLSKKVINALQESLGDCVIDTRHNPSEGGWRECVEFETFHEYFRTGQYVPFPTSPEENR